MSWAARQRLVTLIIVGSIVMAVLAVIGIATFYRAPSCTDGIQNQGEQGIDCGGPCANLCTALMEPPTVLYTQVVGNGDGRADVVAMVENKNAAAAAKAVPYTISIYDAGRTLLRSVTGTLDLPPFSKVPVYVTGVPSGARTATAAFLSIDAAAISWYRLATDPRVVPSVDNVTLTDALSAPHVTATLGNSSSIELLRTRVIALVLDTNGNVIAATQTIVPSIPAQGSAQATFTWNAPFSARAASVHVVPIVPLP